MTKLLKYLVASYCWLTPGWFLSGMVNEGKLWVLLLGSLLLGLPFFLSRLYISTVDKTFVVHQYRRGGLLRAIRGSRLLSTPFWLVISLASGACMLFWLHTLSRAEWILLCLCVPLYAWIHARVFAAVRSQYREYRAFAQGLGWSQWVFSIIASIGWVLILVYLFPHHEAPLLSEVMTEKHKVLLSADQSVLTQILDRYSAYYRAVADMGLEILQSGTPGGFVIAAIVITFVAIASFTVAISAFLIPVKEYRRIFSPLSEASDIPVVGFERSSTVGGFAVLGLLFIYPALGIQLEASVAEKIRMSEVNRFELVVKPRLERFEGHFFRQGTREKLQKLAAETLAKQGVGIELLETQMDAGYRLMSSNVDAYLDTYYSLPAEYMRLGAMLSNSLERKLSQDLTKALNRGEPFKHFERTLSKLSERNADLQAKYQQASQQLMAENQVAVPQGDFWQVEELSMEDLVTPADEIQHINGRMRGAAAGVGAVSAMVATKVVTKALAKGTLKLAAKAVAKGAVSKAGAGGASAAAGAVIGSVIPGAGTLVGAIIGAGVGLVVGVTVDYALLEVEEELTRDEFKQQILQSIDVARIEHRKQLGLE
ncbi:hypothetical protein [Microbulbifer hydrolyticus]|uniref:Uncharacterized protein n=1 Tax=Microbulbifer hydrolyticus TaxID=48074 RepID=A0A6P1TCS6_9GAMM|nr:hypothetical protein [Microbulbifer hydrolyticus]MBB5210112.1 hypothetical protein [Microbulbifer hydrolyticus]QHQ39370.1 hypothetical protein GTQ55_10535 [Microbulbifer hydrolyticus]